ncbi:MAG: hypothetical protein ACRCYY_19895 [Trueperaceae bacterium]
MDITTLKKEAKSKSASTQRLEELARHVDINIPLAVAHNPNTPATALEYLGNHEQFTILQAVAKHPNTPNSVLEKLATHKQESVLEALLEHDNLPLSALESLQQRLPETRRWWLPARFGRLIMTKPALLEQFLTDSATGVRATVAANLPLSDAHFEQLFNDPESFVRAALYNNASLMKDINRQRRLLEHPDNMTRAAIARRSISAHDRVRFVQDESEKVGTTVVQQRRITPAHLEQLANDASPKVREAIAGRLFSTPIHLLEQLSRDSDGGVRAGVAKNRDSTKEILERLSHDVIKKYDEKEILDGFSHRVIIDKQGNYR